MLTDIAAHRDLLDFGDRAVAEISRPYEEADDGPIVVGVSVGIAVTTGTEEGLATLMTAADSALYSAKSTGCGRCLLAQQRSAKPTTTVGHEIAAASAA